MKKSKTTLATTLFLVFSILVLFALPSCEPEETDSEVTAVFSYTVDGNTISFINASVNASTYSWDFGDGGSSTEENPIHTYAEIGKYMVTLTSSNPSFSHEVTNEVTTANAGAISSFIIGKTWIAIRGETYAYSLGPEDGAGTGWDDQSPPWFSWGDKSGAGQSLIARYSLANDEYTFNADGTYDVDFKGDFWGEYGIWTDVEGANETNITIGDGATLPNNTDGVNVDAFVSGTWDWVVDEANMTLEVKGAGAHILNPRLKNDYATFDAGTGITYTVTKFGEGSEADTIVMYVTSDDGANLLREYHTLAAYHGTVPEMKEAPIEEPEQYPGTVNSTDIGHTFLAEDGTLSGVASIYTPYIMTYGVDHAGETCTEFFRGADDTNFQYANFMLRTDEAEIDFSTGSTVKVDVYFPSSNDYTGDLTQRVYIRFIDESRLGGNFWTEYIQIESDDVPLDTWTTLSFDFATLISDAADAGNIPDGTMIEPGGSGHLAGGTFYIKNWIIE